MVGFVLLFDVGEVEGYGGLGLIDCRGWLEFFDKGDEVVFGSSVKDVGFGLFFYVWDWVVFVIM